MQQGYLKDKMNKAIPKRMCKIDASFLLNDKMNININDTNSMIALRLRNSE